MALQTGIPTVFTSRLCSDVETEMRKYVATFVAAVSSKGAIIEEMSKISHPFPPLTLISSKCKIVCAEDVLISQFTFTLPSFATDDN